MASTLHDTSDLQTNTHLGAMQCAGFGLGTRSKRYAMLVEDGVVSMASHDATARDCTDTAVGTNLHTCSTTSPPPPPHAGSACQLNGDFTLQCSTFMTTSTLCCC